MDRYADRFDGARYDDEEPIAIGLASTPLDSWLWVPASLFGRVLAVGWAYDLHILGAVIRWDEVERLNPLQCQGLLDELAFVAELVNDPLVGEVVSAVQELAAACARSADDTLVVDLDL